MGKNIISIIKSYKVIFIIILVIALIPVLHYMHEQYLIHKTRQTFNILRGAFVRANMAAKYKWTEETMNTTVFARGFVKELPIKKSCSYLKNEDSNCFPQKIFFQKPLRDTDIKSVVLTDDFYTLKLKNGVGVAFKILSPNCSQAYDRCGTIFIDINGTKRGPNKFGVDLYDFSINKDEIKTYSMKSSHIIDCLGGTGQGCAEYMLKYKTRNFKKYAKEAIE